jgi:hypothetical protein
MNLTEAYKTIYGELSEEPIAAVSQAKATQAKAKTLDLSAAPPAPILPTPEVAASMSQAPNNAPIRPQSSASASPTEKIKGGMEVYKAQIQKGDVKGAEETGKSVWALANPKLAAKLTPQGTVKGTGQSEMEKQAAELRSRRLTKEDHIPIAMGKMLDSEGAMIKNQLETIERSVQLLRAQIKSDDMQVPAWVQAKITLSTENILTCANYMAGKDEEVKEAYDIVLDYLISEGYASDVETADKMMAVMSGDKIKKIVEQSEIAQRAAAVVDDQRKGVKGDADVLNQTQKVLQKLRGYPNGFPGVKGV